MRVRVAWSTAPLLLFTACADPGPAPAPDATADGEAQEQNESHVSSRLPYAVDPASGDLVMGAPVADRGAFDFFTNHHDEMCRAPFAGGLRASGFLVLRREGRLGLGGFGLPTERYDVDVFADGDECVDFAALQAPWVTRRMTGRAKFRIFGAVALQSYRGAPLPAQALTIPAELRENEYADHLADELVLRMCGNRTWQLPDGRRVDARPATFAFVVVSRIPLNGNQPRADVRTVSCTEDSLDDVLHERRQ